MTSISKGAILLDLNITPELRRQLQKDIPILTAQIRALYMDFDKRFHLNGAKLPITFGFDRNLLGSYTKDSLDTYEHFHFSLLFAGYAVDKPLSKEDRLDLFKHEYAHYMREHIQIPKEFEWQPGLHGSAWKYCCSLIGAAPTPYYKAGEALLRHNYDKVLKSPIHDKTIPIRDAYHREQAYKNQKNRTIHYQIGENINHPKFGIGTVENIQQDDRSVKLHIRFKNETKIIDQSWLIKTKYKNTKMT